MDLNGADEGYLDFYNACIIGNLERAKGVLVKHPKINVSHDHDYLFRKVCQLYGNAKIAEWLLQIYPTIRLHINNNEVFRNAIANRDDDLMKILHQHPYGAYCYELRSYIKQSVCLCQNKNDEALDTKEFSMVKKTGYKLVKKRSYKDYHWEMIKYAVWLHSRQSPYKKGLYCLPREMVHHIIQFIM